MCDAAAAHRKQFLGKQTNRESSEGRGGEARGAERTGAERTGAEGRATESHSPCKSIGRGSSDVLRKLISSIDRSSSTHVIKLRQATVAPTGEIPLSTGAQTVTEAVTRYRSGGPRTERGDNGVAECGDF
jgi:hypothetical protein